MEENTKYKILFDSIKSKFDYLSNADNCLDGKSGTLMGIEIALAVGYISFAFSGLEGIKFYEGITGLVLLLLSIFLLLLVNLPKNYTTISVNIDDRKDYLDKTEKDLLLQLISDAQNAFTHNNKILKNKVKLYKFSILLLAISSLLLILSKLAKFYV